MSKKLIIFIIWFLFSITLFSSDILSDIFAKFVNIKGKYLGQKPPGVIPELFMPFLLDYKKHHIHSTPAFSPNGDEVFFSVYLNYQAPQIMFYTKMSQDKKWTKPVVAPFSGLYSEGRPLWSPDGTRLYFYSKRPFTDGGSIQKESHIWFVNRIDNGWSKPIQLLVSPSIGLSNYPSHFGKDGTFFFKAKLGKKNFKIFKGIIRGRKIESVKKMENPVTVDPRDEYMIFEKNNWSINTIRFEIGFRSTDGSWSKPRSIGDTVNMKESRFPEFSPDGKYFFFTNYRSGYEKIYWVDRKIFEVCKKHDLNLISSLSDTIKNKGILEAEVQYKKMKKKLSAYYPFSPQVFNEVSYNFLANGKKKMVLESLKLNFSLYPKEEFLIEKLLFSILNKEGEKLEKIKIKLINKKKINSKAIFDDINYLAFYLMNGGFLEKAIIVYKINTELFPKSSKAFDRLGRAYMKAKQKQKALIFYKKALELDSNNKNALKALEQL